MIKLISDLLDIKVSENNPIYKSLLLLEGNTLKVILDNPVDNQTILPLDKPSEFITIDREDALTDLVFFAQKNVCNTIITNQIESIVGSQNSITFNLEKELDGFKILSRNGFYMVI
jgi:hypothetical protein